MKPKFTEAVWCCTFHGLLGLHTLKSHVVVGSDRGVFINFPLDVTAPISAGDGVWRVAVTCQEQGGSVTCAVQVESRDSERRVPDVFLRRPAWAESVTVTDHRGGPLESAAEGGYLRLPGAVATQGGVPRDVCVLAPFGGPQVETVGDRTRGGHSSPRRHAVGRPADSAGQHGTGAAGLDCA